MLAVLVGGAGFIGHNLALELKQHGHDVVAIDSLMVNNLYAVTDPFHRNMLEERLSILSGIDVPLIRMDARDYNMLSETIAALKPDVIIHLAAVSHMDRSDKTPFTTFDHSLRTLENALDIAVQTSPKFVYFSSSTVYGDWTSDKATEDQHCNPIGIYGSLKLAGELMVRAYTQAKGLRHVIIRPSALYGPRCVSGRVLQKFIEAAREDKPLEIRSDGKLDFTYIKDLVAGTRLALEAENETFNLTFGEAQSVAKAADIVATHLPVPVEMNIVPQKNEPERGTLDISKAKRMLGYKPEWDLERGLNDYISWYGR